MKISGPSLSAVDRESDLYRKLRDVHARIANKDAQTWGSKAAAEAASKIAQDEILADLAAANASLAAAQKTNRDLGAQLTALEGQFLVMSDSISTIQSQVLALNTKLTTTLKSLSTANAKIKKICSAKPKPKGC